MPLARDSKDLAKLHEDFMKSYAHVKKVNFFETRKQVIFKLLGRFSPTRMVIIPALLDKCILSNVE